MQTNAQPLAVTLLWYPLLVKCMGLWVNWTSFFGTLLPAESFFHLLHFGVLENDSAYVKEDLCWACAACCWYTVLNQGLIALHLVQRIFYSINECSHSENQSRERRRLTSSEALTRFRQSLLFSYSLKNIKGGSTRTVTHRYMTWTWTCTW